MHARLALCLIGFVFAPVIVGHTIQHVVILMLENRSFDHLCGFMRLENKDIDGLFGNETNPYNVYNASQGSIRVTGDQPYIAPWDPCHTTECVSQQVYGNTDGIGIPKMNGFVQNAHEHHFGTETSNVMRMFTPDRVPVITTLAREFALFDRWHSSVPSYTHPNRRFIHAATSLGTLSDYYYQEYNCTTIFDKVLEMGNTTGIYYVDYSSACQFLNLRSPRYKNNFHHMDGFYAAAKSGQLPNYSFVTPQFWPVPGHPSNDEHPDHNVLLGEQLIKDVYEALRNGPAWNNTLYIITYDEHGGYYDHVPPQENVPNPDGLVSTDPLFFFTRLGIRVPTVMVSPWINKGVIHEPTNGPYDNSQFEHSSVPATMKKLFGWSDFLTKRDAWAAPFDFVYSNRSTPRTDCPKTLPSVLADVDLHAIAKEEGMRPVNGWQRDLMRQGCGVKPMTDEEIDVFNQFEAGDVMRDVFQKFLNMDQEQKVPMRLAKKGIL